MAIETDYGLIFTIMGSVVTIVAAILGMMFWMRSEANELRKEAKEDRKDMLNLVRAIEFEVKDFHYRLLDIEKTKIGK
jgi:hypothetical protein